VIIEQKKKKEKEEKRSKKEEQERRGKKMTINDVFEDCVYITTPILFFSSIEWSGADRREEERWSGNIYTIFEYAIYSYLFFLFFLVLLF